MRDRDTIAALYAELVAYIARAAFLYEGEPGDTGDVFYHGHTSTFEHASDILLLVGIVDAVEHDGAPYKGKSLHAACFFKLRVPTREVAEFVRLHGPPPQPTLNRVLAVFFDAANFYDQTPLQVGEPFRSELPKRLLDLLVECQFLTIADGECAWTERARLPLRGPYPDNYEQ